MGEKSKAASTIASATIGVFLLAGIPFFTTTLVTDNAVYLLLKREPGYGNFYQRVKLQRGGGLFAMAAAQGFVNRLRRDYSKVLIKASSHSGFGFYENI